MNQKEIAYKNNTLWCPQTGLTYPLLADDEVPKFFRRIAKTALRVGREMMGLPEVECRWYRGDPQIHPGGMMDRDKPYVIFLAAPPQNKWRTGWERGVAEIVGHELAHVLSIHHNRDELRVAMDCAKKRGVLPTLANWKIVSEQYADEWSVKVYKRYMREVAVNGLDSL